MSIFGSRARWFGMVAIIGLIALPLFDRSSLWGIDPGKNADQDEIDFNRDIRPILSDKCFACHGPDKNKREADLRLDTQAGLVGTSDAPGAVKAGDPGSSKLIQRIETTDVDERMPPAEFGKEIDENERALLRRWIAAGAPWSGHWAFQSPRKTKLAKPDEQRFSRDALDVHVYRTVLQHGLRPSPVESPRTLVRRLSFDLIGLPAEQAAIDRLVADPSLESYEAIVDQLIASPHFGERLAVWWLDLVRYADSVGYHGDQPVQVSPFRDYVIRSLNENKPFDRFTMEQLAGDLLPEPTQEQLVASGYNRLGMMSAEGGAQAKEYLAKYASERVRNLSGAWLGVTIGCSECHDHKYDPFASREFYQLEAFFADIQEQGVYDAGRKSEPWGPEIQVPNGSQSQRLKDLNAQIAALQKTLETPTESLTTAQENWERQQIPWTVIRPNRMTSSHGASLASLDDGSILASGESPATDTYELGFDSVPDNITAIRLEVLPHDSLPNKGPGRAGNGNFVLSEFEAYRTNASSSSGAESQATTETPIPFSSALATYEQIGAADGNPYHKWAIAAAIDRDEKGPTWGWAVMEQAGRPNAGLFILQEAAKTDGQSALRLVMKQNLNHPQHTLGHFRFSVTTSVPTPESTQAIPTEIEAIRAVAVKERSDAQRSQIAAYYRSIAPELEPYRGQLTHLQKALEKLNDEIPKTLVTKRVEPRMIRVLARGNWMDDSGDAVEPNTPAVLGTIPVQGKRLTRMDLAKWVVSRDNPLTARVAVNRLWKIYFGAGLSRKLDDLGAQGEWPSHPELLDELAIDFVESGWDIKKLVKRMVMSETYRQSSAVTKEVAERDPYNRWLSHQGRWRLDAEFVRDNALAVCGLLKDEIGGASVYPYQPARYWAYLNFPQREWQNSTGNELYRRSLYTHWQRQYLHPSLMAFDAPGREECIADRTRSNTPLQALVLLNDPIYVEASKAFAMHVLSCGQETDAGRIAWAIQKCLGRPVRDPERDALLELLNKHREEYSKDPAAVDSLLAVGESTIPSGTDKRELAAWTSVSRALLNLHECITRN